MHLARPFASGRWLLPGYGVPPASTETAVP
jgi:hypothetical protein